MHRQPRWWQSFGLNRPENIKLRSRRGLKTRRRRLLESLEQRHLLAGDLCINEFLFNPPGLDEPNEYIEIRGQAGATIAAGTYLVNVEGDASTGATVGDVTNIIDLSGLTLGSNGYLVFLQEGNSYATEPGANVLTSTAPGYSGLPGGIYTGDNFTGGSQISFENATTTLLLVNTNETIGLQSDVDPNDDGMIDINWTILDSVSVSDGVAGAATYSPVEFTNNEGYVGRIGDSTGTEQAGWVGANLSGSAGTGWTLQAGQTTPASLNGSSLNHIGASNTAAPVGPPANVVINEVRISSPGALDNSSNFVELYDINGTAGANLNGLTLLAITGETDTAVTPPRFTAGDLSFAFDLSGGQTDSDGIVLIGQTDTDAVTGPGDLLFNSFDFFGSPQTFLVVSGFTGTVGDDLDPEDDGEFNTRPWASVLDSLSLDSNPNTDTAKNYATSDSTLNGPTVLPTSGTFAPAAVGRDIDGTGNYVVQGGDSTFTDRSEDTPGTLNFPGYELTETDGVTGVVEGGTDDSIGFRLNVEPTSDVTVTFSSTLTQTTISPTTLTFTPSGGANPWDTTQNVTVSAIVDAVAEGQHQDEISVTTSSSDSRFDGLDIPNVEVIIAEPITAPDVVINEVRISSAVDDNLSNNFVEIFSNTQSATDLTGLTLVVVSQFGGFQGDVNFAVSLDGLSTNSDGFALIADDGVQPESDLVNGILSVEEFDLFGSASAFLLVSEFTGAEGQDLDADDDGTLDFTPWSRVDAIVLRDGDVALPGYDGATPIVSGNDNAPSAVIRLVDGGPDFATLPFEDNSRDTPGSTNVLSPGVTLLDTTGGARVSESVLSDEVQVVLNAQPAQNVTVTLTPDAQLDVGGGGLTPTTLTFTPTNWFVPQTLEYFAVDDLDDEGDHTGTITVSTTSADNAFDGLAADPFVADIIDNDNANHVVVINEILHSPSGADDVNGDGTASPAQDEFVEVLNTADVSIDIGGWTLSDGAQVRHVFAAGTLLAPGQAIVVFGGGTLGTYGNSLSATASSGSLGLGAPDSVELSDGSRIIDFHAWAADEGIDVALARIPDGDGEFIEDIFGFTPGLNNEFGEEFVLGASALVTPTSVQSTEDGPSGTFDVSLTTAPTADVTITLTPADSQIDLGQGPGQVLTLVLNASHVTTPQTVTVTAVDDLVNEGPHGSLITITTASDDGDYDALTTPDVTVSIIDNDAVAGQPGAVVITEIMQNPSAVGDDVGEYFELFNTTGADIDINGWMLSDNGTNDHTINNGGPLNVPAGGYLVLGRNSDSSVNGGINVDYQYDNYFLGNSDDEIILTDATEQEIDRVEYDGTTFPDPSGASMELIPGLTGNLSEANDIATNWQTSATPIPGSSDFGTPGAPNGTPVEAPTLVAVRVNDGVSDYRSHVTSIEVEFSAPVVLSNAPFVLTNTTTNTIVDLAAATFTPNGTGNVITIDFGSEATPGASLAPRMGGNSLADGNYRLEVIADQVRAASDGTTEMAANASFGDDTNDDFFRLLGDGNGDRRVNIFDFIGMRASFNQTSVDAAFDVAYDLNGDDRVNIFDFIALRGNFDTNL